MPYRVKVLWMVLVFGLLFFGKSAVASPNRDLLITQENGDIKRLTQNGSIAPFFTSSGGFDYKEGVTCDLSGNLFVSSGTKIVYFPASDVQQRIKNNGSGSLPSDFVSTINTKALSVDSKGFLYVPFFGGFPTPAGVRKYQPFSPAVVDSTDPGVLDAPLGIALDLQDNLYVAENPSGSKKILKFSDGNLHDTATFFVFPNSSEKSLGGITYDVRRNALLSVLDSVTTGEIWVVPLSGGLPYRFVSNSILFGSIVSTSNNSIFVTEGGPGIHPIIEYVGGDSTTTVSYPGFYFPHQIIELPVGKLPKVPVLTTSGTLALLVLIVLVSIVLLRKTRLNRVSY